MQFTLVRNRPAAKFFYKGAHSHPVRRTVLITEQDCLVFKGYELREGATVRDICAAPIKSFRKDKIATAAQLRGSNKVKRNAIISTLERMSMTKLEQSGI